MRSEFLPIGDVGDDTVMVAWFKWLYVDTGRCCVLGQDYVIHVPYCRHIDQRVDRGTSETIDSEVVAIGGMGEKCTHTLKCSRDVGI